MDLEQMRDAVLVLHIGAGTGALLAAAVVMSAGRRQDWSGAGGAAYGTCVTVLAVTALALVGPGSVLPGPVRWLLAAIAVATAAAALTGLWHARRPGAAAGFSRAAQLRLLWGSVTSLASAVAVVSAPVIVWVPVVVVGTALTEAGFRRAHGYAPPA